MKWSGSKRSVAGDLARMLPSGGRYFEPFLGGGAVLGTQAGRPSTAGDIVPELVAIWEAAKTNPDDVCRQYELRWTRLQNEGHTAFYEIRDDFNRDRSPHDLLFLSRTCVNGLIRFNRSGDFNNSLHHTRKGILPERFAGVVSQWHRALSQSTLRCGDYEEILADTKSGDVAFLDPPYVGTKGRYHPTEFDFERLWKVMADLTNRGVSWVLTLDGTAGDRDYGSDWVPRDLYVSRQSLATGSSPFSRVMENRVDLVDESLFCNFNPIVPPSEISDRSDDLVTQLVLGDHV